MTAFTQHPDGPRPVTVDHYFSGEVSINLDEEGAQYIADVLEQHAYNDAGARAIVDAIREVLGDGS